MEDQDREYWLERARTALKLAERAASPAVAKVHMEFFHCYMRSAERDMAKLILATTPQG